MTQVKNGPTAHLSRHLSIDDVWRIIEIQLLDFISQIRVGGKKLLDYSYKINTKIKEYK